MMAFMLIAYQSMLAIMIYYHLPVLSESLLVKGMCLIMCCYIAKYIRIVTLLIIASVGLWITKK